MTKKGLYRAGLGFVLTAGLAVTLDCSSPSESSAPLRLTLPEESLAFDDGLDVRDALNRPVKSPAARRELRQLFVNTAFALLMRPELPRVAESLAVLQKAVKCAETALTGAFRALWAVWVQAWSPLNKRSGPPLWWWFVTFLPALSAALSRDLRFCRFQHRMDSHLKVLATVVLRC